jgi:Uri superfamily endonuclease
MLLNELQQHLFLFTMKGSYCLVIDVPKNMKIKIGSLGFILFEKGTYIYVGSAMNGIQQRVNRHLSTKKKNYWHIDYLLSKAKIKQIWIKPSNKKEECFIAKRFEKVFQPVKKFGCSDCKCNSHLFQKTGSMNLSSFFSAFERFF